MPLNSTWTRLADPNITGWYDSVLYANSVTSDIFSMALLFSVFAILYMIFRKYGDIEGFATSSFISSIIAGIFLAGNLIGFPIFMLFVTMLGASILLMWKR